MGRLPPGPFVDLGTSPPTAFGPARLISFDSFFKQPKDGTRKRFGPFGATEERVPFVPRFSRRHGECLAAAARETGSPPTSSTRPRSAGRTAAASIAAGRRSPGADRLRTRFVRHFAGRNVRRRDEEMPRAVCARTLCPRPQGTTTEKRRGGVSGYRIVCAPILSSVSHGGRIAPGKHRRPFACADCAAPGPPRPFRPWPLRADQRPFMDGAKLPDAADLPSASPCVVNCYVLRAGPRPRREKRSPSGPALFSRRVLPSWPASTARRSSATRCPTAPAARRTAATSRSPRRAPSRL